MNAADGVVLPTSRFVREPDPQGRWSYIEVETPGNAAFDALPLREQLDLMRDAGYVPPPPSPRVIADLAPLLRETKFPF